MTQLPKALRLISLLACSVVFGLTLSHVLLSPGSRGLDDATWLTVQHTFYGGFASVGGVFEVIGLVATTADAIYRRRQARAAVAPASAALCFLGTLLSYFVGNRPVKTKVENWTLATLPADWSYRDTWETAHAASAILSGRAMLALHACAMSALVMAVLILAVMVRRSVLRSGTSRRYGRTEPTSRTNPASSMTQAMEVAAIPATCASHALSSR